MKRFLRSGLVLVLAAVATCGAPSTERVEAAFYYPPPESQGDWRTLVAKNAFPSPEQKAAVLRTAGLDADKLRVNNLEQVLNVHPEFFSTVFSKVMAAVVAQAGGQRSEGQRSEVPRKDEWHLQEPGQ